MKKSIIVFLFSTLLSCSLAACQKTGDESLSSPQASLEDSQTDTDQPESSPAEQIPQDTPVAESTPQEDSHQDVSPAPEETASSDAGTGLSITVTTPGSLLLHQEGVTLYVSPWDESLHSMPVRMENSSDQNYILQLTDTSVNDSVIESSFSENLNANSHLESSIEFSEQDLAENHIEKVSQIQTKVLFLDSETFETRYTSDLLTITFENPIVSQPAPETGPVVYQQDGITMTSLGLADDPTWGKAWKVAITNDSTNDLVLSATNGIINDSTLDILFSVKVPAGKKAVGTLTIFQNDLEKYQIETITSLEVAMDFQDPSTYEVLKTTEPIILSFEDQT